MQRAASNRVAEYLTERSGWTQQMVRAFVYVLLAVQLLHAMFHRPNDFSKSYWLVNYSQGFIRRGLTGTFMDALVGHPTETAISVATACVAVVCVAPVVLVVELLLRRRTHQAAACAVLLVCSPFVVDQFVFQRRPDQLGIPVLILLGLTLVYTVRWRLPLCAAVGVIFGALCLVHEGVALYDLPIAVALLIVLVQHDVSVQKLYVAIILLVTPSLAALTSVLLFGRPSASAVERLRVSAPIRLDDSTMFDFLTDSVGDSLKLVAGARHAPQLAMLVLGTTLVIVHAAWLMREVHDGLFIRICTVRPSALRAGLLAMIGAGTVLTFLLGVDWLRWYAELGCAWLIASALVVLKFGPPRDTGASGLLQLPRWLWILALYLALLAPLNESLGVKGVVAFLLPAW